MEIVQISFVHFIFSMNSLPETAHLHELLEAPGLEHQARTPGFVEALAELRLRAEDLRTAEDRIGAD